MKVTQNVRVLSLKSEARRASIRVSDPSTTTSPTTSTEVDRNVRVSQVPRSDLESVHTIEEAVGVSELRFGFEPGDLVWAKLRSCTWWPGRVESLGSEDCCLVQVFGESGQRVFELGDLVPFERCYEEKLRQRSGSKGFVKAVEAAVEEVGKRSELGLSCTCKGLMNFGGYSAKQIKKARNGFRPGEVVSFVKELGLCSWSDEERGIDWIRNESFLLAYRKAVFAKSDACLQTDSMEVLDQPALVSCYESERAFNEHVSPTGCLRETHVQAIVSQEAVKDMTTNFECILSTVSEGDSTSLSQAFECEANNSKYNFELGDLVWGEVDSHLWWPGRISDETFSSLAILGTKPKSHMLVALFGHNSHNQRWFDLAHLIPFQPYYTEKSKQTNSWSFTKAVEVAVKEVSRQSALGLACRCRNQFNFRHSVIRGYFAVDVVGYERGGVYSTNKIKKARDAFQPAETLSFLEQLALAPSSGKQRNIEWFKNKAIVLAYRNVVFEEFDAAYDQTVEMLPAHPSDNSTVGLDRPTEVPSLAPVSGPLVVAEPLGGRKSSVGFMKVKDQSSRDLYLDVEDDLRSNQVGQDNMDLIILPTFIKDSAASLPSEALATKPQVPVQVGIGTTSLPQAGTMADTETLGGKSIVPTSSLVDSPVNGSMDMSSVGSAFGFLIPQPLISDGSTPSRLKCLEKETGIRQEINERMIYDGTSILCSGLDKSDVLESLEHHTGSSDKLFGEEIGATVESKLEGSPQLFSYSGKVKKSHLRQATDPEDGPVLDHVPGGVKRNVSGSESTAPLPCDSKLPGGVTRMDSNGKANNSVTSGEVSTSETSIMADKKKRKKSESGLSSSLYDERKRLKISNNGKSVRLSAGKFPGVGLAPKDRQLESQRKDQVASISSLSSDSAAVPTKVKLGIVKVDLCQLFSELLNLAINPFHGMKRNSPKIVRHSFLRFRAVVYQKSLVKDSAIVPEFSELHSKKISIDSVASEMPENGRNVVSSLKLWRHITRPNDPTKTSIPETSEHHSKKSPTDTMASETPEDSRNVTSSLRLPRYITRLEDLTTAGKKRSYDCREDMSSKRMKKVKAVKPMVSEKNAGGQKILEVQRGGRQDMDIPTSTKLGVLKKPELEVLGASEQDRDMPILPTPDAGGRPKLLVTVVEPPTMLVMMFPPQTTLPSAAELKARFARFGPLDHSGLRVFFKSSTCRVVFRYKSHGQAAYRHAIQNRTLFGNVKVNYQLWDLATRAAEVNESVKQPGGNCNSAVNTGLKALQQQPLKPCIKKPFSEGTESNLADSGATPNLKSILGVPGRNPQVNSKLSGYATTMEELKSCSNEEPFGEEAKSVLGVPESSHQKFISGGSNISELVGFCSDSNNYNSHRIVAGRLPSSNAMDIGRMNLERVNAAFPTLPHVHTGRKNFPSLNAHHDELKPRNNITFINNYSYNSNEKMHALDISHEMLSLLVRCNDIVTLVNNLIGYKPYSPL